MSKFTSCSMRRTILLFTILALTGCADNGEPGFHNHPIDCLFGFAHSDCLPGTAGYGSGVGNGLSNDQYVAVYEPIEPDDSDEQDTPKLTINKSVKKCLDFVQEKWGNTFDAYIRPDGEVVDLGFPEQDFHFKKCMIENGYSAVAQ